MCSITKYFTRWRNKRRGKTISKLRHQLVRLLLFAAKRTQRNEDRCDKSILLWFSLCQNAAEGMRSLFNYADWLLLALLPQYSSARFCPQDWKVRDIFSQGRGNWILWLALSALESSQKDVLQHIQWEGRPLFFTLSFPCCQACPLLTSSKSHLRCTVNRSFYSKPRGIERLSREKFTSSFSISINTYTSQWYSFL